MTPSHEQWAAQARYDLDTAKAMLDSGRYLYVLFCCQQAVEKMLKAVIARTTGQSPPRLHNLMRLADRAEIETTDERADLFRELSTHYVQSRYPEEISELADKISREMASVSIVRTEEALRWLSSMI